MSESKSAAWAAWLSAGAAAMSALAAFASLHVSNVQTYATIAEKRVRPRIEWINQNNSDFRKISVHGNNQYVRDIRASTYFAISIPFGNNKNLVNRSFLDHKIVLQTSMRECSSNNASLDNEIATCLVDMGKFQRIINAIGSINTHFSDCLKKINAQFFINMILRIDYLDFIENKRSEYIRLIPLSHASETMLYEHEGVREATTSTPYQSENETLDRSIKSLADAPSVSDFDLNRIESSLNKLDLIYIMRLQHSCPGDTRILKRLGRLHFSKAIGMLHQGFRSSR